MCEDKKKKKTDRLERKIEDGQEIIGDYAKIDGEWRKRAERGNKIKKKVENGVKKSNRWKTKKRCDTIAGNW